VAKTPVAKEKNEDLDRVIHERVRLGIVSALAANEALTFADLKVILKATDGNLSVHARKLDEAGYVTVTKGYQGKKPRTEYRLSPKGREALETYLNQMEAILNSTRQALGKKS
jgi:DNA-binding MarR family transcriptional regulator